MKVEFFRHSIEKEDRDRVEEVLQSIFLTTGGFVAEFEAEFSRYLNLPYTIGLTSCTAALHLALLAWDIGDGDEVITCPMSFCATSNAVMHAGATPVFVDAEEDTGNINAELIESKITDRTKAIIPVHLYGQMCDMKRVREIADKYNLIVIEDAAHCIEGKRDGVFVGQLGDAACYSFYATKNITSGEGGAITVHNYEKADLLRMLRLHGIDKSAADRYTMKYKHWDMSVLGWKYNMDNIQGALLIGQLRRIDQLLRRRQEVYRRYEDAFYDLRGLRLMNTRINTTHACHLFTMQVDEDRRDEILSTLQDNGIGVAVNYRAIHLLKYYRERFGYKEGDFPVAESIGRRTISLPLYPSLTEKEQDYVIRQVKDKIQA